MHQERERERGSMYGVGAFWAGGWKTPFFSFSIGIPFFFGPGGREGGNGSGGVFSIWCIYIHEMGEFE